ncbi:hypothetical protein [Labedella endophytica]|jgi:hypothetical protein|uniref:Lipoprotein n=1 Tax=Labedella endophytica TaxID=1523160 RepID=A0A3S0X7F8_9MICO|nr:hypothetical protein [Labedella endophytica]RUQ96898.1 hypothetical protein ELQ94_16755 [Labedella endophytica]
MIRRAPLLVLTAVATVIALAGCAPDDPDPAAIDAWHSETAVSAEDGGDVVAVLTGVIPRGVRLADGVQVSTDFDAPVRISGAEFSCFGEGTMTLSISTIGGEGDSTSTAFASDPFACADSPHTLPADDILVDGRSISSLEAAGGENDRAGAWVLAVHGTEE